MGGKRKKSNSASVLLSRCQDYVLEEKRCLLSIPEKERSPMKMMDGCISAATANSILTCSRATTSHTTTQTAEESTSRRDKGQLVATTNQAPPM